MSYLLCLLAIAKKNRSLNTLFLLHTFEVHTFENIVVKLCVDGNYLLTDYKSDFDFREFISSPLKKTPLCNWPRSGIIRRQSTSCQTSPPLSPAKSVQSESLNTSQAPPGDVFVQSEAGCQTSMPDSCITVQKKERTVQTLASNSNTYNLSENPTNSVTDIGIQTDCEPVSEMIASALVSNHAVSDISHTVPDLAQSSAAAETCGDVCKFIPPSTKPAFVDAYAGVMSELQPATDQVNP